MAKKGTIELSGVETGLRQGRAPEFSGTSPSLYGRDNEYAADIALRTGSRIAQGLLRSGDMLSKQILRTSTIIEQSAEQRERNMDILASDKVKVLQDQLRAELREEETKRKGYEAGGSGDRAKSKYDPLIGAFEGDGTTVTIGEQTIEFGTEFGKARALEALRSEQEEQRGTWSVYENKEIQGAVKESFNTISAHWIEKVQQFPSRIDEYLEQMEVEFRELMGRGDISEDTVEQELLKHRVSMYTAAASAAVRDNINDSTEAYLAGANPSPYLDAAEEQLERFEGLADKETLEGLRSNILTEKARIKDRWEAKSQQILAQQAAAASLRADNVLASIDNMMGEITATGAARSGMTQGESRQAIHEAVDEYTAQIDFLADYYAESDNMRGGEDFAEEYRDSMMAKVWKKKAIALRLLEDFEYRAQFAIHGSF